ncbi:hypothetical protein M2164_006563 [Streptomyces sp. SAI-208]|uniref:hypothetical protein n=1 Tax=unclassified Streptomyces TaxID=2593676 RepID=UPI002474877F|nr:MULTISPECIES: hypothetical protein [unclassified Streptomyces]MDH6519953.1 hypothetical protein [Streptomyces sp. SAI-090]MDH6552167.1 hypothetical protein [Streptomyces sp. SAI-041]MDH6610928.1 hypothetical protein [Streptomyces sp. SAI-208]MDH6615955.1 hypothetical protein [Streptomyces sp. SAI-135]
MTMRRDVHGELRARLRDAAGAHEPNREQMLARIERGMSEQTQPDHRATRPPVYGWVRVVSATAAVACVLGFGGYAVASAVKDEPPVRTSVAATGTPTPSPDATSRAPAPRADPTPSSTPTRRAEQPSGTPSGTPSASTGVRAPGAEDGPLWSDGSVDSHSNEFWAQSNLTFKTSEQLTALTVELRIAQTGGVTDSGAWRSLPEDDFTLTVAEKDGFLVYTWVLKDGRTVPKGEWVFAGQYNHERGGRDAKDDRYTAAATAASGNLAVKGDFSAQDGGSADGGDS